MNLLARLLSIAMVLTAANGAPRNQETPDPEAVQAAIASLEEGFRSKKPEDTLAAIDRSTRVRADEVASYLVKHGLGHRDPDIHMASVEALGELRLEPGRKALERLLRKDRKLAKDPERMVPTLRALARHGDKRSVPVLADLARSGNQRQVVTARILCLGWIRDPSSATALFQAMKKAGPEDVQNHMRDFRLSFMMLLGVDRGISQDAWMTWWNENKKDIEVLDKAPRLPDDERERWRRFWGLEREYPRPEKRGERGK